MTDLIEFLRARINDDEADARAVEGNGCWDVPSTGVVQLGGVKDLDGLVIAPRAAAYHMERHDPARVLREVEAKRRILDEYKAALDRRARHPGDVASAAHLLAIVRVIHILALPYASHPDYRPEWRP